MRKVCPGVSWEKPNHSWIPKHEDNWVSELNWELDKIKRGLRGNKKSLDSSRE